MIIKVPGRIKIGNLVYEIKELYEDGQDEWFGRSSTSKQTLKLAKNSSAERLRDTFWHEIMHTHLNDAGYSSLGKDEVLIDSLARIINQVNEQLDVITDT